MTPQGTAARLALASSIGCAPAPASEAAFAAAGEALSTTVTLLAELPADVAQTTDPDDAFLSGQAAWVIPEHGLALRTVPAMPSPAAAGAAQTLLVWGAVEVTATALVTTYLTLVYVSPDQAGALVDSVGRAIETWVATDPRVARADDAAAAATENAFSRIDAMVRAQEDLAPLRSCNQFADLSPSAASIPLGTWPIRGYRGRVMPVSVAVVQVCAEFGPVRVRPPLVTARPHSYAVVVLTNRGPMPFRIREGKDHRALVLPGEVQMHNFVTSGPGQANYTLTFDAIEPLPGGRERLVGSSELAIVTVP